MAKTPEEKKKAQHEAWKRWYTGEKGKAYRESKLNRQRAKELEAARQEKVEEPA